MGAFCSVSYCVSLSWSALIGQIGDEVASLKFIFQERYRLSSLSSQSKYECMHKKRVESECIKIVIIEYFMVLIVNTITPLVGPGPIGCASRAGRE